MSISRSARLAAVAMTAALIGGLTAAPATAQTADTDVIFEETGYVLASNPFSDSVVGGGVAGSEWTFWCDGDDPFTQGIDGHVFSLLPEEAASGDAHATLTGDGVAYDLDMHFYDEDCGRTGASATPDLDESSDVPAGTRYVVAVNWFGLDTEATLRVVLGEGGGGEDPDPDPDPGPDPAGCTGTPDHVWFLGIVYDSELRNDFRADVRNFETFLATLRQTYCIPSSQATILAMENAYRDPVLGRTYAEGTEANLKAELRRMGTEASEHNDSQFFFFLSSHGLMWTGALSGGACPATRVAGSFSGLKGGNGEDGSFYDCELGNELNNNFSEQTRMFVAVDCSFCGGFSDSITAASGTIPDGSVPSPSGILGPNRIVITGCAITTECFGSSGDNGGVTYHHMRRVLEGAVPCDGWTAPGFPIVQGFDVPVNGEPFNAPDGRCTASEWFFGAVQSAYTSFDLIGIQQQFRIKYGFDSLGDDLLIVGPGSEDPILVGTSVAFAEDSAEAGRYRQEVTVAATLLDEDDQAIEGEEIVFAFTGPDTFLWEATTGADGVGSVTRRLEGAPGDYELRVQYAGKENAYEGSSAALDFALDKGSTDLDLEASEATGKGRDKERTLTATLTGEGEAVAQRSVTFYCDGNEVGSADTDEDGLAEAQAPHNCAKGSHLYEAVFDGDDYYSGSEASEQS